MIGFLCLLNDHASCTDLILFTGGGGGGGGSTGTRNTKISTILSENAVLR